MAQRLEWSDRWMSADGVVRPIREMTTDHLWNVLGYLRWFAPVLAGTPGSTSIPPTVLRPWLLARPIWISIARDLYRRGEVPSFFESAELVLRRLEQAGQVPWECL
jgi:hypothetical protein